MKYKGKISYPKVGDSVKVPRHRDPSIITKTSHNGLKQGDLVMGYEKGVHCVMGFVDVYYAKNVALLKRVYTDKIQPTNGSYSICDSNYCKSPREFFKEYKEKYTIALNVINEYLG